MTLTTPSHSTQSATEMRALIGQKLMLDLRYFCQQGKGAQCREPMTSLPPELKNLLHEYQIGGVILFAENVQDIEQIVALTEQLHGATEQPPFIAIDQEGGRVARINRAEATSFTGNMSIGASYAQHGTHYAHQVASAIGKELAVLGINVNFAPTVDVNANPDNPVINVRSFGEDPQMVAKLGAAQVNAFEQQGVISAIKHFPGHGDTNVDSHTGLPRVNHTLAQIHQQDIAPFATIIKQQAPGMIMTAHIQYPALDDTQILNKHGAKMLRPATMSRKIMHDLLRGDLGYQGVTITDALDMAGISDFFEPEQAVIETFAAGVDIALMPFAIRSAQDIHGFREFMENLCLRASSQLDATELRTSAQRIQTLKARFLPSKRHLSSTIAQSVLGNPQHRKLEAELALAAITEVKNDKLLPLATRANQHIHLIMPDKQKALALKQALLAHSSHPLTITLSSLQGFNPARAKADIENADWIIAGHATPAQSAVEIGGMEDVTTLAQFSVAARAQPDALKELLTFAQSHHKPTLFISLRAPYEITRFAPYSQAVLASYAYNVDVETTREVSGPAYTALAKVILGQEKAKGILPVTLNKQAD
ncbi:glycoside hydrolase family 3 protein [Pseudoalteromonas sp. OOF1S-7]|uniref:glycoside hydrolase family 3 protein n=1 Tax=Pseudoalteromonas sp. OOF1S-7 TaxID=2917757 RepID=UPI001EF42ABC|nr:glycoside hydrolase family 3 protein [Pseudoalteromonas sp. OOF1S-7]MCG7537232.1 glycoside hydrolase family 3 protein [Pseudoalteromonas sp. OOF1S-7]